jgi:general L-amino acid transport system permease protein
MESTLPASPPVPSSESIERPRTNLSALAWLRKNLFRTWYDSVLTIIVFALFASGVLRFIQWVTVEAEWTVITTNFSILMRGQYPADQVLRVSIAMLILIVMFGVSWAIWGKMRFSAAFGFIAATIFLVLLPVAERSMWGDVGFGRYMGDELIPLLERIRIPLLFMTVALLVGYAAGLGAKGVLGRKRSGRTTLILWFVAIPLGFLLVRGLNPDTPVLPYVRPNLWGGLLLTFMLAFVAITLSFPLGVLLALGRMSGKNYPIIREFCVWFIEIMRGVPLVTVFFAASLVVPLALGTNEIDDVVRAMVALTLFEAAYIAEIVRGGLQAIPRGQTEAAKALGLGPVQMMSFIILPQAVRIVIPTLVGQFITMFKDTSLVVIIPLTDLMGIADTVTSQPQFTGNTREVYVFVAIVYFVFSYGMSYAARQLEQSGSGRARR